MSKLGKLLLSVSLLAGCGANEAFAHSDVLIGCSENIPIQKAEKISEMAHWGIGIVIEQYDTDGDGYGDVATATQLRSIGPPDDPMPAHKPLAQYYFVDRDKDHYWDEIYEDLSAKDAIRFTPDYPCKDVVLLYKQGDEGFIGDIGQFWIKHVIQAQN